MLKVSAWSWLLEPYGELPREVCSARRAEPQYSRAPLMGIRWVQYQPGLPSHWPRTPAANVPLSGCHDGQGTAYDTRRPFEGCGTLRCESSTSELTEPTVLRSCRVVQLAYLQWWKGPGGRGWLDEPAVAGCDAELIRPTQHGHSCSYRRSRGFEEPCRGMVGPPSPVNLCLHKAIGHLESRHCTNGSAVCEHEVQPRTS